MAKKKVTAQLNVLTELKTNGLRLAVHDDGDLLGYLDIGKAKIQWTDKHGKTPSGESDWEGLIEWMKAP